MKNKYKCLLLVRISTTKQQQESDSPEHQIARGLACAQKRYDYSADEVFILTEAYSGRKEERPCLDQAFEMVEKHRLEKLLVYDIDRLTRAGAAHYELIKRRFKSLGCDIVDVKGIIQPDSNTLEGTGGTFGEDFTYDWSVFAASEKAEIMEAQMAKDEARKILSRTIPVQIKNAQLGRTNRQAPYGYRNCKIIDDTGKPQPSKEIVESEAFFLRRIYEGMSANRDLRNLCDELNGLGFKSRTQKKWNQDHSQVIGQIGGLPLSPAMIRQMIVRPVNAGFVLEKWTHGIPVPANHDGIVDVDLWNLANRGRWKLIRSTDCESGWELVNTRSAPVRRLYRRERPDFPFKSLLKCTTCGKPFKASFSRSESGKRIGYYHCNRGHKQVSARLDVLHLWIQQYLGDLAFTPEVADRFEEHIRAVWVEKVGDMNRQLASANKELAELRQQGDALFEKIKLTTSALIIKRLEKDYEDLHQRIKLLEANRDIKEFSESDMNRAVQWARKLVERLDELIVDAQEEGTRSVFWSLVFCTTPTLEDIKNRTADISPLVRLKGSLEKQKNALVPATNFRSNLLVAELGRWAETFNSLQSPVCDVFSTYPDSQDKSLPQAA